MRDYKIYLKINRIIEERKMILSGKQKEKEQLKFLGMFNYCLSSLKEEYILILQNTYLTLSYQFWWLDYYSKSSFYRKRFTAVSSFVALFEMIYENFNDCPDFISFA